MTHGRKISTHTKALVCGLALLTVVCAVPQMPKPAQSRTVPLVSDTCPTVRIGDRVSLDWNSLFDPIWPVTGLRDFGLTFAAVADDGVNLTQQQLRLRMRRTTASVTPLGNDFFHIEIGVSNASKKPIPPGTYRLVGAIAVPGVVPEYTGELPKMTRSPVDERYCVTVVNPLPSKAP